MGYLQDYDATLAGWMTSRGINPASSGVELVSNERYEGRKVVAPSAYRDAPVLQVSRSVASARRRRRVGVGECLPENGCFTATAYADDGSLCLSSSAPWIGTKKDGACVAGGPLALGLIFLAGFLVTRVVVR